MMMMMMIVLFETENEKFMCADILRLHLQEIIKRHFFNTNEKFIISIEIFRKQKLFLITT